MIGALLSMWSITAGRAQCVERFPTRAPQSAQVYFHKFDPVFGAVGARRKIDPALLKAVAYCETRLDPCAESPAGARGLMQFIPSTFDLVQKAAAAQDPFDPMDAVEASGVYLAALSNYWRGDIEAVVASYNAGPGAVAKARRRGRSVPDIEETRAYVACVLSAFQRLARKPRPSAFSAALELIPIFRSQPKEKP